MIYFSHSLFYSLLILNLMGHFNRSLQETDGYDSNDCRPRLADGCFNVLAEKLRCHGTNVCGDVLDMCPLLNDSLKCAADVIDGDCSKVSGLVNFHSWLKGLRAVHSNICDPVKRRLAGSYLSRSLYPDLNDKNCWNRRKFVSCVGQMLNIHHVVDLLNTTYGYNECIRMVISMTTCNAMAESDTCDGRHKKLINDLVHQFFSEHKCNDFSTENNGTGFSTSSKYFLLPTVTIMVLNLFSMTYLR